MVCVDDFGGGAYRVVAAPEFYRIEHEEVAQGCYLIHRKNPECEKYQLIDEFGPYLAIPVQDVVGEGETAYTGVEEEAASKAYYY